MKLYLHSIVFLILLYSCATNNSGKKEHENNKATATTEIKFLENVHDFGLLTAGEIVVFTFSYTNIGAQPFELTEIKTDCGCIRARALQSSVAPNKSGQIEVEFDSSGLHGKQYKSIEICGNSKDLKHLAIFAQVKNEILDIKY